MAGEVEAVAERYVASAIADGADGAGSQTD